MRWVLVMWLYVGGSAPEDHGVQIQRIEMHRTEAGCEWARQETVIARGHVARAWCEPHRGPVQRIVPKSRPAFVPVAEVRL